jgi:undecaprenyl-diphosphatase
MSTRLLDSLERRFVRRLIPRQPDSVDAYFEHISEAAQGSRLWLACAGALAAVGGERGRRAAREGVLAIALTSAVVNVVLKPAFRRRRPPVRRRLRRRPRTSSFPSGHSASAFAFAAAVTRTVPEVGPVLLPLASSVAYSRVYLGVHYPTDVYVGATIGTVMGAAARPAARTLSASVGEALAARAAEPPLRDALLVVSPHAGSSRHLAHAKKLIKQRGVHVRAELDVSELGRLRELLATADAPQLVIAAGGDGTVGAVAGCLAGGEHALAILPLGTSNDYARSLEIPMNVRLASMLLASGRVRKVDVGRVVETDGTAKYFVHAATAGVNVNFAKLATRASVRARLGRLTYLVAAVYAMREREPVSCVLEQDGDSEQLDLLQLSVVNAPIVGGALEVSIEESRPDDHRLAVIAVEDVAPPRLLLAGLFLLLRVRRPLAGVRTLVIERLGVSSAAPTPLALDGEVGAGLPGRFEAVPDGLRVLVSRDRAI